jgi:peptidase E
MAKRRIMATSGGFMATSNYEVHEPGATILESLRLTGKTRPKVCLLQTASGDPAPSYLRGYQALSKLGCEVTHLSLFTMPTHNPIDVLTASDFVWVGGGSVANLLAVWRVHRVDEAMAEAWNKGVILGGVSAGSICWHIGGATDSFGPTLQPISNGLGLIPYANGVHYDSEAQRRPLIHSLVGDGTFGTAYCTDDRVGILYEDTEPVRVITDLAVDPLTGPAAYRVERVGGEVVETRLTPGTITGV